jgi:hypothetical protein
MHCHPDPELVEGEGPMYFARGAGMHKSFASLRMTKVHANPS